MHITRQQIVVIPIIYEDGRFLLTDRQNIDLEDDEKYRGCWQMPGGSVDLGEDPEIAVAREAKEELGIQVLALKTLATWTITRNGWQGVFIGYQCQRVDPSQPIKLNPRESSTYGWFTLDEIRTLQTLPYTYEGFVKCTPFLER